MFEVGRTTKYDQPAVTGVMDRSGLFSVAVRDSATGRGSLRLAAFETAQNGWVWFSVGTLARAAAAFFAPWH
jgi:hypothetical protein